MKGTVAMSVRKTPYAILICVVVVLCQLVAVGCNSPAAMVDKMKEHIPEAVRFVEDNEEHLSVLFEIQARIQHVLYLFYSNNTVRVVDFTDGIWGEQITHVGIARCDFLSEEEKAAMIGILSSLEADEFFELRISISSESTQVYYKFESDKTSGNYVEMYIRNEVDLDLPNSDYYYCEKMSDAWYAVIFFSFRA